MRTSRTMSFTTCTPLGLFLLLPVCLLAGMARFVVTCPRFLPTAMPVFATTCGAARRAMRAMRGDENVSA